MGGAELLSINLANEWHEYGHEVEFVIIENKIDGLSLKELAKRDGTTVANYKVKIHRAKKALLKYLSCFILLYIVRK